MYNCRPFKNVIFEQKNDVFKNNIILPQVKEQLRPSWLKTDERGFQNAVVFITGVVC